MSSWPASIAPFLAGLGRPPALPGSSFRRGPCRESGTGPPTDERFRSRQRRRYSRPIVLSGDRSGAGLIKRTVARFLERVAERVLASLRPELERLEREISDVRAAVSAEAQAAVVDGRLHKPVVFGQPDRVDVAETAVVNDALFNTVSGAITIEADAFTGHGVALLTGTHDISLLGLARQRAVPTEGRDIVIETGAWVASRAVVLGPCRVGAHAVVAAGAVVTEDVPPGAIVAGVPARVVGWALPGDDASSGGHS